MKEPGTYEYQLGDLVLPGIAHCTKKDILIFNTNHNAHSPVYVVESSILCNQMADTEIPICLAYNQYHYEAFVPDTDEDIRKTILLKQQFITGNYSFKMTDVFGVQERKISSKSFAEAAKNVPSGNFSSLKQKFDNNKIIWLYLPWTWTDSQS